MRKKAVNTTLQITAGTLGVMTLEGKEIYLEPDTKQIPVPRYLIKLVTTVSSGKTDVYVVYNNPYGAKQNIKDEIEEVFGNTTTEFSSDVEKGYAFQMTYEDFKKAVNKAFKGFPFPKSYKPK